MAVIIDGSNTPTLGGAAYGDGSELAFSAAGTSGQVLVSAGGAAPVWQTSPAALYTSATYNYVAGGGAYTWQCTNLDSFTTYTVSSSNGSVSFSSAGVLSYSPATVGIGGFTINGRAIPLTIVAPVGYLESLNSVSAGYYPRGAVVDSLGNLYSAGYNAGNDTGVLQKINGNGVLQFQIGLSNAGNQMQFLSVAIDTVGDIIAAGPGTATGKVIDYVFAKYNSSGVLQWQRAFGAASPQYEYAQGVATDPSNNIIVTGFVTQPNGGSPYEITTAKYNSSGTLQWQKKLAGSYNCLGYGVATDASSNIYVLAQSDAGSGKGFTTAKYNSAGTLQWQRFLKIGSSFGSSNDRPNGITVDSALNVYITGNNNAGSASVTAKYNLSGVLQWQRTMASSAGWAVALDSSSNVYVLCTSVGVTIPILRVIKYNSSGVLQYQKSISSTIGFQAADIKVNATSMYITAQFSTSAVGGINMRLPLDGSLTGPYTVGGYSVVYANSTETDSASAFVDSAGGLTDSTPAYTSTTPTLTATTTTFTSATTLI